jgi:hypothetical protein
MTNEQHTASMPQNFQARYRVVKMDGIGKKSVLPNVGEVDFSKMTDTLANKLVKAGILVEKEPKAIAPAAKKDDK